MESTNYQERGSSPNEEEDDFGLTYCDNMSYIGAELSEKEDHPRRRDLCDKIPEESRRKRSAIFIY